MAHSHMNHHLGSFSVAQIKCTHKGTLILGTPGICRELSCSPNIMGLPKGLGFRVPPPYTSPPLLFIRVN